MERESFLDWISKIDFEKVHDGIYAKKHRGTGDWLIQKEEFQTWFSSLKSSLLWCHGKREYHPGLYIMKHAY
jgi:ankyrin repeat domain-containing protein 50